MVDINEYKNAKCEKGFGQHLKTVITGAPKWCSCPSVVLIIGREVPYLAAPRNLNLPRSLWVVRMALPLVPLLAMILASVGVLVDVTELVVKIPL